MKMLSGLSTKESILSILIITKIAKNYQQWESMSKALKMGARQTLREIVFSLINNQW
jgi:hypothetical protein